ncbi:CGNR zinc finger domain-containing protein [Rhizobium sp. NPDC090275]|uniref:CGNR zinc finger domain-containing protein n=1 Tax=Rhizobium sp. NPDC090275 TaxID=3364498 RepID=UPI00383A2BEE
MAKSVEDMRLSGGHPALDFVNTVDSRRNRWGPDFLGDYIDVIAFGRRVDLVSDVQAAGLKQMAKKNPDAATKALEAAVELRECLHRVFLREEMGGKPDMHDVAYIGAVATEARGRQALVNRSGDWTWAHRIEAPSDLVHVLASSAAELLTTRSERRPVKECKGDNCGWLFLDRSKGGRRIWCSEESCGVHSRVRKFRSH